MKAVPQINRAFQVPVSLLKRVERLSKKRGLTADGRKFTPAAALREAFMMWCDAEEAKGKKPGSGNGAGPSPASVA